MQVIEEFIHIVGLGMKDFHNAYLMTGNLGKKLYYFYALLSSHLSALGGMAVCHFCLAHSHRHVISACWAPPLSPLLPPTSVN
jgi:hypothetical protein